MTYTLLLLGVLLFGLIFIALGAVLLLVKKNKLAGSIILAVGLLTVILTFLGLLSLVIVSRTMG